MLETMITNLRNRFPDTEKVKLVEPLLQSIIDELRVTKPHLAKIAHTHGVPIALVRAVFEELPNSSSHFTRQSEDGWGRSDLRKYIVARKTNLEEYAPEDSRKITYARAEYDDGLCELVTGRDGDFLILYKIPRKQIIKRARRYFVNMEAQ